MEPCLEDGACSVAEQEAAFPNGGIIDNDFIGIVEGAEGAGQFEEVCAEDVRTQISEDKINGARKADEFFAEGDFLGCFEVGCVWEVGCIRLFCFAKDAVDPSHGVEQVGGSVALKAQHFIP